MARRKRERWSKKFKEWVRLYTKAVCEATYEEVEISMTNKAWENLTPVEKSNSRRYGYDFTNGHSANERLYG